MDIKYILYANADNTSAFMAQVLKTYQIKYEIITDLNEGLKLGRGHVNPSKYCIAVNCDTKEVFTDFLTFCVDVKEKQFVPCININNL